MKCIEYIVCFSRDDGSIDAITIKGQKALISWLLDRKNYYHIHSVEEW